MTFSPFARYVNTNGSATQNHSLEYFNKRIIATREIKKMTQSIREEVEVSDVMSLLV
jgi:hypothetical protein